MAEPKNESMFPKLSAAQIARLEPFGRRRKAAEGEVIFDQGETLRGFYVLISGSMEVVNPTCKGEAPITIHEAGEFTGEVDMLSGRGSLVRGRIREASELLEIERANLLRVVQTDAELGEIFLRAFLLRRSALIANTGGDVLLVGSAHSSD